METLEKIKQQIADNNILLYMKGNPKIGKYDYTYNRDVSPLPIIIQDILNLYYKTNIDFLPLRTIDRLSENIGVTSFRMLLKISNSGIYHLSAFLNQL